LDQRGPPDTGPEAMDTAFTYAYRLLGSLLQSQVEPLAAELDSQPSPDVLEAGRRDAAERAANLRARLAGFYADAPGLGRDDALAAYEAAKSLLADLWSAVLADAEEAVPVADRWARGVVSRAVARGAASAASDSIV
jgi:hypothetical protein